MKITSDKRTHPWQGYTFQQSWEKDVNILIAYVLIHSLTQTRPFPLALSTPTFVPSSVASLLARPATGGGRRLVSRVELGDLKVATSFDDRLRKPWVVLHESSTNTPPSHRLAFAYPSLPRGRCALQPVCLCACVCVACWSRQGQP